MAADAPSGVGYLGPSSAEAALAVLPGPVRRWFRERFGKPTAVQRLAWPALQAGEHLLLSAPTGSGKTLAAFLPILARLLTGPLCSGLRALYVAPLKALCSDARKNLRFHLRDLAAFLPVGCGSVRIGLRTGDTPARVRRILRRRPPNILLTTPESLAVLLSQPAAAEQFADLRWVVVDEIHAVAGNKRGADLALSLERLTALAGGELQRIGLSATCAPLVEAARFLVGPERTCRIAAVGESAPLDLAIEPLPESGNFLTHLMDRLERELTVHRSTLIFTNTRSLAERLAWAMRRRWPAWDKEIAVHHSALARARRRRVERGMKQGRLRAVVSSTSLELGMDLGSVDAVVLVHPPGGVVRLLQRVGRGGHSPGRPRRGLVLTATPAELLEAAVTGASGRSAQWEPLRVPSHPLDVLCQQLLGMAAQRPWAPEEAFALVRRAYPYRDLARRDFDDCLDYLSGRDRNGRSWLPARLRWVEGEFVIRDRRTARLVWRNLGTILTDEQQPVHLLSGRVVRGDWSDIPTPHSPLPTPVGELDDAFAERLQPGDRFLLDGRCLEFRRREGPKLLVDEVIGRPVVPRWNGAGWPLSADLARRLYLLRVQAAEALRDGPEALARLLQHDYGLGEPAVRLLVKHFQKQECLSEIPDSATCLVEIVPAATGADYYFHTPLGRAGNDALARVAVRRLVRDHGRSAASIVADLGFALFDRSGAELTPAELRALLAGERFDADLAAAVADSVALRECFRRVALIGLMLLRNPRGGRPRVGGPDWAERRLFDHLITADPDFVLLRQARREVHEECCDAGAARAFAEEMAGRTLHVRRLTQASPFAQAWTQLAAGPAESAESPAEALERLHALLTGGGHGTAS
ncbi:MAG TPA: DEAD/DEAH box helicase [Gemmataceae bacterium]|nr:DEAD/DEAH box helicase [Gemmataceae bacterium]